MFQVSCHEKQAKQTRRVQRLGQAIQHDPTDGQNRYIFERIAATPCRHMAHEYAPQEVGCWSKRLNLRFVSTVRRRLPDDDPRNDP